MKSLLKHIKQNIAKGLPGEAAHQKMAPTNRPISSLAIQNKSDYKESAVAVIIHNWNNEAHIILTERQTYKGAHSGQISFPGGKREIHDENLLITAIRETNEEIGLFIPEKDLISPLTQVYIPVSNFLVKPYLFITECNHDLSPDIREVKEIIHFPLKELLDNNSISTMEVKFPNGMIQKNIPCFKYDNKKIWGATALILNELKEISSLRT